MEKKGDTFTQIVTIYYINLSLNLSALIHDLKRNENTEEKKEHLHYPTLKDRKPNLILNLLAFQAFAGFLYAKEVSRRRYEATRQKSTHGPTTLPWKRGYYHVFAAKPGTQVPSFGEELLLTSRTFLVYLDSGIFVRIFV